MTENVRVCAAVSLRSGRVRLTLRRVMGFTLATFNVKDLFHNELDGAAARDPQRQRAARVYREKLTVLALAVQRLDADVVAFQEVQNARVLDDLRARLPEGHRYGPAVCASGDARGIACGLLSRLEVRAHREHASHALPFPVFASGDLPPFPPGRLYTHRPVLEATIALPDGGPAMHLFVVHFKSALAMPLERPDGTAAPIEGHRAYAEGQLRSVVTRAAEALFVRSLVDARLDEARAHDARSDEARICVAGDFNDAEQSFAVRAVAGDLGLAGSGLPAVDPRDPSAGRALYPCARAVPAEQRFTTVHRGVRAHIDHVLVSRALWGRFRGAKILNETLVDDVLSPGPDGFGSLASDHAPLRAEFG